MIVGLCDRFHCLPSQLMQEPTEFLTMIYLTNRYSRQEAPAPSPATEALRPAPTDEQALFAGMEALGG